MAQFVTGGGISHDPNQSIQGAFQIANQSASIMNQQAQAQKKMQMEALAEQTKQMQDQIKAAGGWSKFMSDYSIDPQTGKETNAGRNLIEQNMVAWRKMAGMDTAGVGEFLDRVAGHPQADEILNDYMQGIIGNTGKAAVGQPISKDISFEEREKVATAREIEKKRNASPFGAPVSQNDRNQDYNTLGPKPLGTLSNDLNAEQKIYQEARRTGSVPGRPEGAGLEHQRSLMPPQAAPTPAAPAAPVVNATDSRSGSANNNANQMRKMTDDIKASIDASAAQGTTSPYSETYRQLVADQGKYQFQARDKMFLEAYNTALKERQIEAEQRKLAPQPEPVSQVDPRTQVGEGMYPGGLASAAESDVNRNQFVGRLGTSGLQQISPPGAPAVSSSASFAEPAMESESIQAYGPSSAKPIVSADQAYAVSSQRAQGPGSRAPGVNESNVPEQTPEEIAQNARGKDLLGKIGSKIGELSEKASSAVKSGIEKITQGDMALTQAEKASLARSTVYALREMEKDPAYLKRMEEARKKWTNVDYALAHMPEASDAAAKKQMVDLEKLKILTEAELARYKMDKSAQKDNTYVHLKAVQSFVNAQSKATATWMKANPNPKDADLKAFAEAQKAQFGPLAKALGVESMIPKAQVGVFPYWRRFVDEIRANIGLETEHALVLGYGNELEQTDTSIKAGLSEKQKDFMNKSVKRKPD